MKKWKKVLIYPEMAIIKAIEILDKSNMQIVLVVDQRNFLLGTVTDGDIRRGILRGISLSASVDQVMNCHPTVAKRADSSESRFRIMKSKQLHHIPIVDADGCVTGIETLDDLILTSEMDNLVVLMAGGLGTRLRPLTDHCPKPLLKVGGKPILETIVESFVEQGFHNFCFSVNYMASSIEEYFGNGAKWGAEIRYIREDSVLGTAGALGLLPERTNLPVIVMNSDLLTKVDFRHLLKFHNEQKAKATMCVREYVYQIPYGVVTLDEQRVASIEEKPVQRHLVSAGINILDPEVVDLIQQNVYLDMPTLFRNLIQQGYETTVFPIREYWLDIGRLEDYDRANGEFSTFFK